MVEITRSFEIEVDIIDDDHRRLVDSINEIIQALNNEQFELCAQLVPDFVDLSKQHFRREESLLAKYDYPQTDNHIKHHASLDDKMETMLALATKVADSPPAAEALRKELIFFMMDDIINEDMDFKSFMVNATAGKAYNFFVQTE